MKVTVTPLQPHPNDPTTPRPDSFQLPPARVAPVYRLEATLGEPVDVGDSGHWSWTDTDVPYTSTHSSAEWILEAPQVDGLPTLVAGDGTSFFRPTSTYTVGSGAAQTIASGDPTQIDLTTPEVSTINLATPSALASDGQSFDVCVYATSCATP